MRRTLACVLLLSTALVTPIYADFYDGLRAYDAKDYATAVSEWQTAANTGDAKAQYRLGQLYQQGLGVAQNYVEAHRWYSLAAMQGHEEARDARNALAEKMSAEQVAEAQELASTWEPKAPEADQAPAKAEPAQPELGPVQQLFVAAEAGDVEAVKAALKDGVDPNATDPDGFTALFAAAAAGQAETVRALLDAGANVNAQGNSGATALMAATLAGHTEVVRQLVEAEADTELALENGQTALTLAQAHGNQELVELLGGATEPEPATPEDLFLAAAEGDTDRIKTLLDSELDVNAKDDQGWTALHFAAMEGQEQAVETLLEAGAEPNATAEDGMTVLMAAAMSGDHATTKALLMANADPRAKTFSGLTALQIANQENHVLVRNTLLPVKGVRKDLVSRVQVNLKSRGYYHGETNGVLDPKTLAALSDAGYLIMRSTGPDAINATLEQLAGITKD